MCGRLLFYYSIKVNKEVLGKLEEDVYKHGGCFFFLQQGSGVHTPLYVYLYVRRFMTIEGKGDCCMSCSHTLCFILLRGNLIVTWN